MGKIHRKVGKTCQWPFLIFFIFLPKIFQNQFFNIYSPALCFFLIYHICDFNVTSTNIWIFPLILHIKILDGVYFDLRSMHFVFNLCEETISRTDEGQPRPKYIFNKCGTNSYFFTLQRFGPSPSLNFKLAVRISSIIHF